MIDYSSLCLINTNVESHHKRCHGTFLLDIPLGVLVGDIVELKLVGTEHSDAVGAHLINGFPFQKIQLNSHFERLSKVCLKSPGKDV